MSTDFETWFLSETGKKYPPLKCKEKNEEHWFDKFNPFTQKEDVKEKTSASLENFREISFADLVRRAVFENKEASMQDIAYYTAIYNWTNYIVKESSDLLSMQQKLWLDSSLKILALNEQIVQALKQAKDLKIKLERSFHSLCETWKSSYDHEEIANQLHMSIYEIISLINRARRSTLDASRNNIKSKFTSISYDELDLQLDLLWEQEVLFMNEVFWFMLDEALILASLASSWNIVSENAWLTPDFSQDKIKERQEQISEQVQSFWKDLSTFTSVILWLSDADAISKMFMDTEDLSNSAKEFVWEEAEKVFNKLWYLKPIALMIAWEEPEIRNTTRWVLENFSKNNQWAINEFKSLSDQLSNKESKISLLIRNPNTNWDFENNMKEIRQFFENFTQANQVLQSKLAELRNELIQIPLDQKKVYDWYSNLQSLYWTSLAIWVGWAVLWWYLWKLAIGEIIKKWYPLLKLFMKFWSASLPMMMLLPWQRELLEWKGEGFSV